MSATHDPVRPLMRLPFFFSLVFALSAPLWWTRGATELQLMPGLSVSALMGFCPMVAALILLYWEGGIAGARALVMRSFDFKRIKSKRWLVPLLFLLPVVSIVVYGLMRWVSLPLPTAQFHLLAALLMLIAFFVEAMGEALGWTGYALEPMQP
jgi:uncharacterized protein